MGPWILLPDCDNAGSEIHKDRKIICFVGGIRSVAVDGCLRMAKMKKAG